jgi:hypothetical protein
MIAVVDIDGVLADAGHRQHHVESSPKDWDAFFAAVGDDAPIPAGLGLVRDLATDHRVVLLSGRPERTRADTEAWLDRHDVGYERLLLRPDVDRRTASVFKAEAIRGIGDPATLAVVVDDDESVVETLTRMGYATRLFR